MSSTKRSIKDLSRSLAIIAIILLIAFIGQSLYFRIDLTKEKRYKLSSETKSILKKLDETVIIKVYLAGELNIQLNSFQNSIRDLLEEFRVYGRRNIQFEFVDPFDKVLPQEHAKVVEMLYEKGLKPVNIHHRKKDGSVTEKLIIPGASVNFNGVEIALNLLLNDPSKSSEENLNNSIESLEYSFISAIKNLTTTQFKKIAFIEGHGEWPDEFLSDIMHELSKSFQVDRGRINAQPGILDPYACVIIAGPVSKFSEADKFVLDQYLMKGNSILWLLDGVNVDFDSLAVGYSIALPNELNLEDMLFRYGARINPVLVQDAQCNELVVNIALAGNKPKFERVPWLYYPIISPNTEHMVTHNLNMVLTRFVSSIDTIEGRTNIKKTPLLTTSSYSRSIKTPAVVELQEMNNPPLPEELKEQNILAGVLLEGAFESVFKNRMIENYFDGEPPAVIKNGQSAKMAVIADADIIRNDIVRTENGAESLPLGFDRATNRTFGNKQFLVNLISYLSGDTELIQLRNREIKLRLLNKAKLSDERFKWQVINMVSPLVLLIVLGIAYNTYRPYRYSK
ncbi:MAG TPA: gliding motility-associated ABC transporter substrate-binding protein GldG [Bacteroidales bacterium]|jgi:ABC-2 type transport system permease protein|nr:gliding motility-associated ABC transporter substrate-binding protein GldG [Bacteroidales bacterium]